MVDKVIILVMLTLYLIKIYVAQHRLNEILTYESILNLIIIVPIMATPVQEMNMFNRFYILLAISRFMRTVFFCVIMTKFYDLGETDVDRQITLQVLTMILIIIVSAGIFGEIENSWSAKSLNEDYEYVFKKGFTKLYFHDSFYFCVVTLITVGYGDLNPTNELSKILSQMIIIVTIVLVP